MAVEEEKEEEDDDDEDAEEEEEDPAMAAEGAALFPPRPAMLFMERSCWFLLRRRSWRSSTLWREGRWYYKRR